MRVACVLASGFEDSEFKQPYDALKQAGHEVMIVGMEAGQRLNGDKGRETAVVDKAFAEVSPDQFDALFIPGGFSPDRLRSQQAPVAFVKAFFEKQKPVVLPRAGDAGRIGKPVSGIARWEAATESASDPDSNRSGNAGV